MWITCCVDKILKFLVLTVRYRFQRTVINFLGSSKRPSRGRFLAPDGRRQSAHSRKIMGTGAQQQHQQHQQLVLLVLLAESRCDRVRKSFPRRNYVKSSSVRRLHLFGNQYSPFYRLIDYPKEERGRAHVCVRVSSRRLPRVTSRDRSALNLRRGRHRFPRSAHSSDYSSSPW